MKIKKREPAARKTVIGISVFFLVASVFFGCNPTHSKPDGHFFSNTGRGDVLPYEQRMKDFVLVWPEKTDTFDTLAEKYLGDVTKGWLIAKFNRQNRLFPGKPLIVPLKTIYRGGLEGDSYQKVPILVYHQFSDDHSDKLTIKTETFYEQMRYLKDNGYVVIGLDQLLDFMEFKSPLPEKAVVITIDDGWVSTYDIAYPIMKEFGFTATMFVYTDFIERDKAMTWSQIKEMVDDGFDVQSHTHSYQSLTMIRENQVFKSYFYSLVREIENSKMAIRNHLDLDCRYLAYPYGETNPLVISLVKKLGYRAAFSVGRGGTPFFENPYNIGRSIIYGDFDIHEFINKISHRDSFAIR